MSPLARSRRAAKAEGEPYYWTGVPCVKGHLTKRRTSDGHCLQCEGVRQSTHKETRAKAVVSWRNSEKGRRWKEVNRERLLAYWAERDANPSPRYLELRRIYDANVKSKKRRATPPWLMEEHLLQIINFYREAARLTKATGVRHEVDHILPLNGKKVSGLNVPWNMQILTKSENARKGNRYAS